MNLQSNSVPKGLISSVLFAEGGLGYHWETCLKGYNQDNKVWTQANSTALTHFLIFLHTVDFKKQMANLNVVNHCSPPPLFLCLPVTGPPSPPLLPNPPPPAPPAVQQQCDRSGGGSTESGAVPRSDLPGVAAAHPPAGCTGLHLRRAAAALSVQLG